MDEPSPPKPDLSRVWPHYSGPAMLAVAVVVAMLAASAWFGVLFVFVVLWSIDAWLLRRTMMTALDLSGLLDRIGDQRDEAIRERRETVAQLAQVSRQAQEVARTSRLAVESARDTLADFIDRRNLN